MMLLLKRSHPLSVKFCTPRRVQCCEAGSGNLKAPEPLSEPQSYAISLQHTLQPSPQASDSTRSQPSPKAETARPQTQLDAQGCSPEAVGLVIQQHECNWLQ